MTLEGGSDLSFLDVDDLDLGITAPNCDALRLLVKAQAVSNSITGVDAQQLLNHSDVPELDNTVRVTG